MTRPQILRKKYLRWGSSAKDGDLLWDSSSPWQPSASLVRRLQANAASSRQEQKKEANATSARNNKTSLTQTPRQQGRHSTPSHDPCRCCFLHTSLFFLLLSQSRCYDLYRHTSGLFLVLDMITIQAGQQCTPTAERLQQCRGNSWPLMFLSLLQSQSSVSVQHLLLCLATVWIRQPM